jgi:hypothetical protein
MLFMLFRVSREFSIVLVFPAVFPPTRVAEFGIINAVEIFDCQPFGEIYFDVYRGEWKVDTENYGKKERVLLRRVERRSDFF